MKNIYLICLTLFIYSCSNNCPDEQNTCPVQNLEITENNKIPITIDENDALFSLYPLNWYWKNLSDNLIETIYVLPSEDGLDETYSFHLVFSLQNNCIDLIRDYRKIEYHDIDPNTFEEYISNIVIEDENLNFDLQEYIPNNIVVAQNNDMKFWIEFDESNHLIE